MEQKKLTRSYLETLSSADLISLADEYGIDIPDNLNRRFIIGELLEVSSDLESRDKSNNSDISEMSHLSDEESSSLPDSLKSDFESNELPKTFNETEIDFTFRNPVWVYVYWDIKNSDIQKINDNDNFEHLSIRVSYFNSFESNIPTESFDMKISLEDRAQFIMLSANKPNDNSKNFVRIDLVMVCSENLCENLAISKKIALPQGSEYLSLAKPGCEYDVSEVFELSGFNKILKNHYEYHRESFA